MPPTLSSWSGHVAMDCELARKLPAMADSDISSGHVRHGIPTARAVDHVGVRVPDLDEAIDFFTRVIGCDLLYRTRASFDPTGDWMARHYAVHPRARLETAMLRCGPATNVELLAWDSPDSDSSPLEPSGVGGHLAFFVDDLHAATAYLAEERGVQILGPPTIVMGEPNEGTEFVYVRLPWGSFLELVWWPPLMPYCAETTARLHAPAIHWSARTLEAS